MKRLGNPISTGLIAVVLISLATLAYRLEYRIPLLTRTIDTLELRNLDWRFELRGPISASDQVVILAFDDHTMQADPTLYERRDGWVRVFDALAGAGASAVGVDALFVDPERLFDDDLQSDMDAYFLSQPPQGESEPDPSRKLLARVHHATKGDERLVAAIQRLGTVVLACHLGSSGGVPSADPALTKSAYGQALPGGLPPVEHNQVLAALPAFNAAARSLGVISVSQDSTSSVRKLVAVRMHQGATLMPLAFQLVALHEGVDKSQLIYLGDGVDRRPEVRIGQRSISLDLHHAVWLNYRGGPKTFTTHSLIDLLAGDLAPDALRGKIVLLGYTFFGHDQVGMPFSRFFPGVEVHATAVDNLLTNDFLRRPAWWVDGLICFLFGLALVCLYWKRLRLPPWLQAGGSLVLLLVYLGVGVLVFVNQQLWLNWIGPLSMFLVVSLVCLALSYLSEGLARRRLRHAFAHYLADDVIEQILVQPEALKLGGERRELTVLFSDIRGFTTISEGLEPEALTSLLNEYLTPMTRIVFDNKGLLDKYMGDAIMAIYGAPVAYEDHACAACETALQMLASLEGLCRQWQARGLPEIDIGIGVNTGPMSVGNMGAADRFDYTVIGDHVNLGSRLEGLNKQFGTRVIVSEFTRAAVADRFTFRELDLVVVKGKQKPVRIFELIHRGAVDETEDGWIATFEAALQDYRAQHLDNARIGFERLAAEREDKASLAYLERCLKMEASPPGADWDGVFRATTK